MTKEFKTFLVSTETKDNLTVYLAQKCVKRFTTAVTTHTLYAKWYNVVGHNYGMINITSTQKQI